MVLALVANVFTFGVFHASPHSSSARVLCDVL
jgi:hypothetical protein